MLDRNRALRRGRLQLAAILTLEEATLSHMGPRESSRLIATTTYTTSSVERDGIVRRAKKLGFPVDVITDTWDAIAEMETNLREVAA
ncbi:MAG: hypothetical protein M3Z18_00985 [Gemmatimonadota bacterium]|nr:hypothetical protein [Gemmatimonadota bacterium]